MSEIQLGRLERVDLRSVWTSEASYFTPWLARPENLKLLGDTIGIVDLELEAQEQPVGPFRADILCRRETTSDRVLIENQLERTDHSHLGQLLTYAAGVQANTIIWIAARFTEEHRAALDWLNQFTDTRFNFFGLEIELWRIGESGVAPKFNVVCKPNDWSKIVHEQVESGALSETKRLQVRFWTAFRDYALARRSTIRVTKPLPQHWISLAIGRSGFSLAAVASLWDSTAESYDSNEIRAELLMNGDHAKSHFTHLESQRGEIEAAVGYTLIWHSPENARSSRIFVRQSADLRDETAWPDQHKWLLDRLEEFHRAFATRIRNLAG